jgi:hypothetical protein
MALSTDPTADALLEELDVYVDTNASNQLMLLQYPTILSDTSFFQSMQHGTIRNNVRLKPKSKMFEEEIQLNASSSNPNFSMKRAISLLSIQDEHASATRKPYLDALTYSSAPLENPAVQPLLGIRTNEKLIFTRIGGGVLQMRPSLQHTLQGKQEIESSNASAAPMKAIQLAFKKKETEEELSARLKSFSYLQKVANEEPWVELSCDPSWHGFQLSAPPQDDSMVLVDERLDVNLCAKYIK